MTIKNISKTFFVSPKSIKKQWLLVDAKARILGRLAAQIAKVLRGKHKVHYTPYIDCGDNIIVINANKIQLTGKKIYQKIYYRHTGFPGGIKSVKAFELLSGKHPERVLKLAIKRMMPKESPLARTQLKSLHIYAGNTHPHAAQKPDLIELLKS